jgi:hypothetical protein
MLYISLPLADITTSGTTVFVGIVASKGIRALICVGDTYRSEANSPPTVTDTPPNVVGNVAVCAVCGVAAKPSPKMFTHPPGASVALEDTPFNAVKNQRLGSNRLNRRASGHPKDDQGTCESHRATLRSACHRTGESTPASFEVEAFGHG